MADQPITNPTEIARRWNILCHLSALSGLVLPFGALLVPLVIWLMKRTEYPGVDVNGKESINFQLSCLLYFCVSLLLMFLVVGIFLLLAVVIFDVIMVIVASIKVGNDESYQYPLTIRFIK